MQPPHTHTPDQLMPSGFLVINPADFNPAQVVELHHFIETTGGWQHPDTVRWIAPVESTTTTRTRLIKSGWPSEAIDIAR